MLLRSRPNIPPLERTILLVSKMESYKVELGAKGERQQGTSRGDPTFMAHRKRHDKQVPAQI